MSIEMVFGLFGGLALFLFGMNSMGEGLQNVAENKMQLILGKVTNIPILGVMVGSIVTMVIQSSSATTVMVVGFVNAGLMTLKQSICIIMGANIGTTVTSQLIAFKLTDFFLPMIAIGFMLDFLVKKKSIKYFGQFLFGFGILLMGLNLMTSSMSPLKDSPAFQYLIVTYGNYALFGLLTGAVMTIIIQSSSAEMGILIALCANGLVPLEVAIPIILGLNIGTCITTIIASIGTKITAKRAAAAHVMFNLIGASWCLIVLPFFQDLVIMLSPADNVVRQVANAHTIFNVTNTLLFLPFIAPLSRLVEKIVPGKEKIMPLGPIYLDKRVLSNSSIAINLATKEMIHMGEIVADNFDNAIKSFIEGDTRLASEVFDVEKIVNTLNKSITEYLALISKSELSEQNSRLHTSLLHAVNDLERVGDHADNIAELSIIGEQNHVQFSDLAINELHEMHDLVSTNFRKAIQALTDTDKELACDVLEYEEKIDTMEKTLRKRHIDRLTEGLCQPYSGILFLDALSNMERIGDHATNIAHVVNSNF